MEKSRFLPVTEAILLDRPETGTLTDLVARTKMGFVSRLGETLAEL